MGYEDLASDLVKAGVPLSPAECHGSICGLLCTSGRGNALAWVEEVLVTATGEVPDINQLRDALTRITDASVKELSDPLVGSFQPMVPDDDQGLGARTDALAQWAESYLGGLGLGGIDSPDSLSDEAKEALTDLAEIAKLENEEAEDEELEVALSEVHEYLRVVVQLLCTEFAEQPGGDAPGGATLH